MSYSVLDNVLHLAAGGVLATPLVWVPSPLTTFCVFTVWGLLREQAQGDERGASFMNNWFYIWNSNKLLEGFAWGVGGGVVHQALILLGVGQVG
ncbi:MAG: hypothetical protein GY772_32525 [bacterium]|jgi:hypothetical protein|nr:hypothetical protein [Roseobacter sp.]MCP4245287.1 hypothetical protein [bacterium]|tara:strand:- start:2584 stop:2865 length:282 start_codon:yes stop_codon:yes gene_type:complete